MLGVKKCRMCEKVKSVDEYRKYKHTVNGKEYINEDSYCIDCRRDYDKRRHRMHREDKRRI